MTSERESLLSFLAYNMWANTESLNSVRRAANPPDKAVALPAHIVGTEWVWLERIKQSGNSTVVWPEWWTFDQTAGEIQESAAAWRELLEGADLDALVSYANSKGERFENSIAEIAMHMLFHGTYHRGQIATLLRQSGSEPAYTDYIHYVRTVSRSGCK